MSHAILPYPPLAKQPRWKLLGHHVLDEVFRLFGRVARQGHHLIQILLGQAVVSVAVVYVEEMFQLANCGFCRMRQQADATYDFAVVDVSGAVSVKSGEEGVDF